MNIASLVNVKRNPKIPELAPGDTVKVSAKIVEAGKERIQPFQGVVIRLRHSGISSNFTVRRVAYGIGVERTFPLYSPIVEKVEVIRHGKVRRSKLYYLRGRSGKMARIKERRVYKEKKLAQVEAEEPEQIIEQEQALEEEEVQAIEQEQAAEEPEEVLEQEPEPVPEQEPAPESELVPEPEQTMEQKQAQDAPEPEPAPDEAEPVPAQVQDEQEPIPAQDETEPAKAQDEPEQEASQEKQE